MYKVNSIFTALIRDQIKPLIKYKINYFEMSNNINGAQWGN